MLRKTKTLIAMLANSPMIRNGVIKESCPVAAIARHPPNAPTPIKIGVRNKNNPSAANIAVSLDFGFRAGW